MKILVGKNDKIMWTDVKVRHGEDGKKCITVLRKRLDKKHKAKQHQEIKVEDMVMVKGEENNKENGKSEL